MKELMCKEHYCCKIHTLLTKSSAYPPFPPIYRPPPIYGLPLAFSQVNLNPPPPSVICQNLNAATNKGGSHYIKNIKTLPSMLA